MSTEVPARSILFGMGLALTGFAVFSLHDVIVKSVRDLPVFQIVFFVVLFSFVPFAVMLALDKRQRSLRPRRPSMVALRCLFTSGSLLCAFYAFTHLPLSSAYSLIFSAPILITLLAIPVLGEKIRVVRWIAVIIGLIGVLVVLRPGAESHLQLGHAAALMAALCVACTSVITRKIGAGEHSTTLVLYPMLTNIVVSGVGLAFVYEPMPGMVLAKLGAAGVLSVVGQMLMINAYRSTEAQFIAPMQYSQMLWALLYGSLLFKETADRWVLVGAAIIVLSGLLFIWRELVASITKPVLRTRNLRAAGGPQTEPMESDP